MVQAGLIPQLRRGGLSGSDRWGFITARPGERPLQNLEAAGLEEASSGLARAARGWLADHPDKSRLIIILDQFEELLAVASPPVRQDFLNSVRELLEADLSLTVILVMRDEFFSRFAEEAPSGLFEWMQRGFVHLSANLEEDDLRRIITGPAEKVGLKFEDGLVDVICKDVMETTGEEKRGSRSTMLPLLEFALTDLWMRRKDGYLTHEAYKAIGGVTGSLTQRADHAYLGLVQEGLGDVARRVLTELVSLGDERQGIPDSRRRRSMENFGDDPTTKKVIKRLADARLVATSFDPQSKKECVEIIHDTLIREWGRLRGWLHEDRSFLSWDREMEKRAAAWEEGKHDEGRLLRGLDLSEAQGWLASRPRDICEDEQRYIQVSMELQNREERRRNLYMQFLAALAVTALAFTSIAIYEWNQADQKTEENLALYLASQSERITNDRMQRILLAVESLRHKETAEGDMALRSSIESQTPPRVFRLKSDVRDMAFNFNGSKVLIGKNDGLFVFNVSDSQSPQSLHSGKSSARIIEFSPDGGKALAIRDETVCILDTSSGQTLSNLSHIWEVTDPYSSRFNPYSRRFSPDSSKVLIESENKTSNSTVFIWDALTGQKLYNLSHKWRVYDVVFSPDSRKVVTVSNNESGGNDSTAFIWNILTGQLLHNLSHTWHVTALAFSPDSSRILTGSIDGIARIWDASTGHLLCNLSHQASGKTYSPDDFKSLQLNSVIFSPDSSKILTGSFDGTARIWDASSSKELHRLHQGGMIFYATFSPDGSKVLTEADGDIRIWDALTGEEIHRLPKPLNRRIVAVRFSPDGSKVFIGDSTGTAWIWPVFYEDLIKQACACKWITENLTAEEWKRYKVHSPKTCPKEGGLNQSILTRLWNDPLGFLTGSPECQPCIAEEFVNKG